MKITRTLLLVLVVAISLAGLTATVRAQPTTQPAVPVIGEGDNVTGDNNTPEGPAISGSDTSPTSQPVGPKKTPGIFENPMLQIGRASCRERV